jgi:hypothetical protein
MSDPTKEVELVRKQLARLARQIGKVREIDGLAILELEDCLKESAKRLKGALPRLRPSAAGP